MAIPSQWYHISLPRRFLLALQESMVEVSSRVVRIRSRRISATAITRTCLDSRKLTRLVLHGDVLIRFCSLEVLLKKRFHRCLLCQFLRRFCIDFSTDSTPGSCDDWI